MNLRDARLCLDCDEIFDSKEPQCPACSTTNSVVLDGWLKPLPQLRVIDKTPPKVKRKRSKNDLSGKEVNLRQCA